MNKVQFRYFVGDFETTVYQGQTFTEVWASAMVELFTEDVKVLHSIDETFAYLLSLNSNIVVYYHNLKFDGSFWLSYLLKTIGMPQAFETYDPQHPTFCSQKDMPRNSFSYSISGMGQWYRITIKTHSGKIIEIRDSLKLLPFSVKKIGNSFGTAHKKLDMEYKGVRYAGCTITEKEEQYIKNDVLVVKEALEIMFTEGHKKLTIGSCCLAEYRKLISGKRYDAFFPNVYEIQLDENKYGSPNAGEYIRKSYHGGWCYLVKGKENTIKTNGTTADVNSLYPSMMSSESGNFYPVGEPTFWEGDIPDEVKSNGSYYFVRLTCRFKIKPGKLPFVQIKTSLLYKMTEMLETSDIYNPNDGQYYSEYYDAEGNLKPATVTMTMTMIDYQLFREHYDVYDLVIHDGCYFKSEIGIFDKYIEKYKKIKLESKGAKRELAKLFLNNLYGKMASSTNSNYKVAFLKDNGAVGFYTVVENGKKPGYIPVGSAITSYARNFTIRAAQTNYHGVDKPGFIYADTDSIHCDLNPKDIKGIVVHPKNFCCWKLETCWDIGLFVRQKTYAEHVTHEDEEPIDTPYFNLKCAGMPETCKQLFLKSMAGEKAPPDADDETKAFLSKKRTLQDFTIGLRVPGKLLPKRIPGGVLLTDTTYEMR